MATRKTGNFAYDNPALVATIASLVIGAAFIFALVQSASGHHGPSSHGSAKPSASPSGAAPAATAAPSAKR